MNTSLLTGGYIPTTQPYSGAPWSYSGTESVGSIPALVVDWILVELRTRYSSGDKTFYESCFLEERRYNS